MNKGYTKIILSKIESAKVGEVITLHDFPMIPATTANTILCRIANQQDYLLRVKKGVFSKAEKTRFGIASATPLEILSMEIHKDDNKCFGGLYLFNQLNLTTQVPTIIEILNNKSSYTTKVGNTPVRYVRIRPKITIDTKQYIILLEALKKIQSIPDVDISETFNWFKKSIADIKARQLKQLVNTALDYPPRVRAILGNLLEKKNNSLSRQLEATLNKNSYYCVGPLIEHLDRQKKWNIKR